MALKEHALFNPTHADMMRFELLNKIAKQDVVGKMSKACALLM
jgi:hypothetical protein